VILAVKSCDDSGRFIPPSAGIPGTSLYSKELACDTQWMLVVKSVGSSNSNVEISPYPRLDVWLFA